MTNSSLSKEILIHILKILLILLIYMCPILLLLVLLYIFKPLPETVIYNNTLINVKVLTILIFATFLYLHFSKVAPFINEKINLNLRSSLIELLDLTHLKIKYYRVIIFLLKAWNALIFLPLVIAIIFVLLIVLLSVGKNLFNFDFTNLENALMSTEFIASRITNTVNQNILYYIKNIITSLFFFYFSIGICGMVLFAILFPNDKNTGLPISLEIPIYFIRQAIDELNELNFLEGRNKIRYRKTKILNLLNDAFEFITLEDKLFRIPYGLTFPKVVLGNINNESVRRDIIYRINGLSIKFEKTMVSFNWISKITDKEKIRQELVEYLDIIETENLRNIEPVNYISRGLSHRLLHNNPFIELLKFIPK